MYNSFRLPKISTKLKQKQGKHNLYKGQIDIFYSKNIDLSEISNRDKMFSALHKAIKKELKHDRLKIVLRYLYRY